MASAKRYIEETQKYTRTVAEMNRNLQTLDDDVISSLLELVKGIDQLLTKPATEPGGGNVVLQRISLEPTANLVREKRAKTTVFDVGVHLPRNYNTPVPPLNEKNCPELREERRDYRPVIVNPKKKKNQQSKN